MLEQPTFALPASQTVVHRVQLVHIIPPEELSRGILIKVPQQMLFLLTASKSSAHPVAVGRHAWRTRPGAFIVTRREENPTNRP
jgi:hypothetical protein